MAATEHSKQRQRATKGAADVCGIQLPRDVWSVILAAAAKPLQHVPDDRDCFSHAKRWLKLATVCKEWHEIMLQQPVGLRFDDHIFPFPPTCKRCLDTAARVGDVVAFRPSEWSVRYCDHDHECARNKHENWAAEAAVLGLAGSRIPVCRLHVAINGSEKSSGHSWRLHEQLTRAFSALFKADRFQLSSGPHLTEVMYEHGFELWAPLEAFTRLQRCNLRTHIDWGPPLSLQSLGIKGEVRDGHEWGCSGVSSIGACSDDTDVIAWLPSLRQLTMLSFSGCYVSKDVLAALPPSLTSLQLRQCMIDVEEKDFPRQLCCTKFERFSYTGLFDCSFELAAGVAAASCA